MNKWIKFQITTQVDPWGFRRKIDRIKKENILFSYANKTSINPLDVKDRSSLFIAISKDIITDWLKIDKVTTLGLDYPYITDDNSQLCAIVDNVLHEKFTDSFIANYDRSEHAYNFSLLVDVDNYQLIEYNVEDLFGQFKYKEFDDNAEFDVSFILKVTPDKNNLDRLYLRYRDISGDEVIVTDSASGWANDDNLYDCLVGLLVNKITSDWYSLEYYKVNDYILGIEPTNKLWTIISTEIMNIICEKFPKDLFTNKQISSQCQTYLFELKIKNKKLQSLFVQDIQDKGLVINCPEKNLGYKVDTNYNNKCEIDEL